MNDSSAIANPQAGQRPPWLLLIHQIPPKPDYFRVKVRRRLHRIGAVALKNSVYALPNGDEALEDFQWLLREIVADGGEAMICEASFVAGITHGEIMALFAERHAAAPEATPPATPERVQPGRTWVTRPGVMVDRMASAWLIRRFIDPDARFRFGAPQAGDLRFDMFEAEFTHEGDKCTFEVLLEGAALRDSALRAIAEIIHDIDLKDDKFGRAEVAGIKTLIDGIRASTKDDAARIGRGTEVFNDLYEFFRRKRR